MEQNNWDKCILIYEDDQGAFTLVLNNFIKKSIPSRNDIPM